MIDFEGMHQFASRLEPALRQWLRGQLGQAIQTPPAGWAPWHLLTASGLKQAGWVPSERLLKMSQALDGFRIVQGQGHWHVANRPFPSWGDELQRWLESLHQEGLIPGWRDEQQDGLLDPEANAEPGTVLRVERAGLRFLGIQSQAVHVNGFTPQGDLWVGLRSLSKSTDPGLYDNLMAGGFLAGETWPATFARELQEEAGLSAEHWPNVDCTQRLITQRVTAEGFHNEVLWVINLELPLGLEPKNHDGEVARFDCLAPNEVVKRMQGGQFTIDGMLSLAAGLDARDDTKLSCD